MIYQEILQTKISPPALSSRVLRRGRVEDQILESARYRLTTLQASAGCGKSTVLAALANNQVEEFPMIWYQLGKEDSDVPTFIHYLLHATRRVFPNLKGLPFQLLQGWDTTQGPIPSQLFIDHYINALCELAEPVWIILDDIHLVLENDEIALLLDRLISLAPIQVHFLLSSRSPIILPNLFRWQSQGEVLNLDQSILSFTFQEIQDLYQLQYNYELTLPEIQALLQETDGWALALQAIWQSLRTGAVSSIEEALSYQASTMENLFTVLIHEVLEKQPEDIQDFLLSSATLRVMTAEACDALRNSGDSKAMLDYLIRQDLFLVNLGNDSLRYQHIFHRLLRQGADEEQRKIWHGRAAEYFAAQGDCESAIYHAFHARKYDRVAQFLMEHGAELLRAGYLDSLGNHLDNLPPEKLLEYPILINFMGDLARLKSRFQESLGWYEQAESLWRERGQLAEVGRALRGQARVYLDTVNPSRASELLQKALRLSDGTDDRAANARLYELLAENKLNAGKLHEAEIHQQKAKELRQEGPSESELHYRVLLRTGKLIEAREKLEIRAKDEREQPVQTPRAHRETLLVLSLIYAFQGEAEAANQSALEGKERGLKLQSPFVTAVGHIRQGHALMLLSGHENYQSARVEYETAVEISHSLAVPRLRVEAHWGLCRAYGYQGDLERALQNANLAIKIAHKAGDEWIASLVRLTMGANFVQAGRHESAAGWLKEAQRGFRECSDPFGTIAVRLWWCLRWFRQGEVNQLRGELEGLLTACRENQYGFLFTRPTLLGPSSERELTPLLIMARNQDWEASYARDLLKEIGLSSISLHPGYQMRVVTLGEFSAWRGPEQIAHADWQRTKSRHLFQLLITFRDTPLEREQIYEFLWPGASPDASDRNFKVVLSNLYRVLEPNRTAGSDSAYILREDSRYSLRPEADILLDVDQFLALIRQGESLLGCSPREAAAAYEQALVLYQGEYLPDTRYEIWTAAKREQLSVVYLQAADHLCKLYLEDKEPGQTIQLCQQILAEDNCWERAYRYLMAAYAQIGDHGQVARTYQRCVDILQKELNILPSPETHASYQELVSQAG
ncbi:MAG: BTAD domain-containing putative transcriptional regulator [Anaerolineales bacterium]|nr:BTAD domain-containing putative transcriptional regulator [Anaerolineales bacterium]